MFGGVEVIEHEGEDGVGDERRMRGGRVIEGKVERREGEDGEGVGVMGRGRNAVGDDGEESFQGGGMRGRRG